MYSGHLGVRVSARLRAIFALSLTLGEYACQMGINRWLCNPLGLWCDAAKKRERGVI
jgi:hypothetical protein